MTKIPKIKFVKSAAIKNSAIKEPQPSLQSEIYRGPVRKHNNKAIKIVNHFAKTAAADIRQSIPTFYHPDFEPSSLMLPKDRIEINSWCNYFYKYDALVSTAVDMHSELPLSKIRLDLPTSVNKKKANRVLEHYVDMIGNTGIDLFNKLLMFGVEYYKVGNVFPWAQMNPSGSKWDRLTCLNPDYIHLEKLGLTNSMTVSLVPDDKLRHIVHAGESDEKTGALYRTLSEDVIEKVNVGKEIPLSTDPSEGSHVSHLARKLADYIDWGTSIIERNFKTLVYKDRLRQSQDAIATRHLTPKHLIWADYASRADVNEIREQVEDAMLNPDSAIITNYELHWELVGTSSGLMQLATEREWVTEDLLVGLMINKNVLLGEGRFAGGQTVLEVLNQRYAIFREVLESFIERNLFIPIARNNDFIEYAPGTSKNDPKEVLLYPKVRWNKLNLTDDTQHKQMLAQAVTEGKVDVGTWLEHMGLNQESIAERLKANEDTVLDPTYNELRRSIMMEVGRSLGPGVAKVYADAYGIELEDQGGGGFGMFGSSKVPITKFAKNFDIDYGDDGSLIIKPKIEIVEYEVPKQAKTPDQQLPEQIKTAESREQRRHNRQLNHSNKKVEESKEKYEVKDTGKKLKPPRKDLQNKKVPKMFIADNMLDRQFDDSRLKQAISEEKEDEIKVDLKPVSEISVGYDNMPFQSPQKVKELVDNQKKVSTELSDRSKQLMKIGIDEHSRKLMSAAENEITTAYYGLTNKVANSLLNENIEKRVKQIYASVYHCLVCPTDSIFSATQSVKGTFSDDIAKKAQTLIQKIELMSTANRKVAQKLDPKNVVSKSIEVFQRNESNIRKAFRDTIDAIITDIRSLTI